MRDHRTTARGALLLSILTAVCLVAASASLALNDPPQASVTGGAEMIFPVVGAAKYFDDWGDPRGQGRHAGNDILTTWRSPAVAAEAGKIKFWTTSARAGCMLYLYGASGTTYIYIHLNNDLTSKRDNRGKCVAGVAYAKGLKNGARVKAGQLIGYNGDSGDAEGTYHLHFEIHPKDGKDIDPFPYLNEARTLLFPIPAGKAKAITLGLKGTAVAAGGGVVELSVTSVRVWPGGTWNTIPARSVELAVPGDALLDDALIAPLMAPTRQSLPALKPTRVLAFTRPAQATLEVSSADPGALSIDRIRPG